MTLDFWRKKIEKVEAEIRRQKAIGRNIDKEAKK